MKATRPSLWIALSLLVLARDGEARQASGVPVEIVLKGTPSKSVKGEAERQNLKGVVLKGDATLLRWTDLVSVNGRPVRDHVEALKQTLKDALCPDCRGGGVAPACPECIGTGKVYKKSRACETCKGSGTGGTACTAPGCDKGKAACPGPCFKRSAGTWDDKESRVFFFRPGDGRARSVTISSKHLGDLFEFKEIKPFANAFCPKCKGMGQGPCGDCPKLGTYVEKPPAFIGACKICAKSPKGRSWIACPACQGEGSLPCTACFGTKTSVDPDSSAACTACTAGIIRCANCGDTGLLDPKKPPAAPTALRTEIRKALAALDEGRLKLTDRLVLHDGRFVDGAVIHASAEATALWIPASAQSPDPRVLTLGSQKIHHQGVARAAPAPAPAVPAVGGEKPPGPDTVILKDGTKLQGRILIRSEQLIMMETADGKRVKIDTDKIAEIKSAPK